MTLKKYWFTIMILVIQVLGSLYLCMSLPADAKVPIHWNYKGEIDNYASVWSSFYTFNGINVGLFLFFLAFPLFSPWYKKNQKQYEKLLPVIVGGMIMLFAAIYLFSLITVFYPGFNSSAGIDFLIGILLIFLGNLMPKIPKNFFIGIRTPWSLSSDEVWFKTHRVGGYCFVMGGILMLFKGFLPVDWSVPQMILTVSTIALFAYPVIYSFILFKQNN